MIFINMMILKKKKVLEKSNINRKCSNKILLNIIFINVLLINLYDRVLFFYDFLK